MSASRGRAWVGTSTGALEEEPIMHTILRIVVPTDFSDCSLQALDEAVSLAHHFGAKIHLLHVVEEVTTWALGTEAGMAGEVQRQTLHGDVNAHFVALAPRLHGVEHDTAIRTGRASNSIVDYARETDADLILMATHGRTGLARFFVGSTTEAVVRKATCPVLTVRPQPAKAAAAHGTCVTDQPACECLKESTDFRTLVARRGSPIRVRDAMRRDVAKVLPDTRVHEIIDLMIHYDISGVPVVNEKDELLGYIPESHLLVRSLAEIAPHLPGGDGSSTFDEFIGHQRQIYGKTAREVMRPVTDVATVEEFVPLVEAVRTMLTHNVSRLPVLRGQKVVGYLTRADILRVVRSLEEHHDTSLSDEEVSHLVRQALGRSPDLAITNLTLHTENGTVSLQGSVSSAAEVETATAIACRVPGVKTVANWLLVEQLLK